MLVRSGSCTLLVVPLYTIAEPTRSTTLEPSVYYATVVHVLIAKFVKAILMNLCRNISFVSTVKGKNLQQVS